MTPFISDNCPQLSYDAINAHSISPGESKLPSNILNELNWDMKTFPRLHADGKNGLYEKRSFRLSPKKYFKKRLLKS